ncbi:unnamed protein product [Oncorhynchus mykiss]|uniref:EFR3 homolog A (S. cerevisiae) n=1 Tax=Oncorhynchus mykiss TaxID=8022 RepID=A0A060W7H4_ONCMY|nr:unnamed protein product [Oncorhynchus mykiss]
MARHDSNTIIKFAYDTVVGLIPNIETAYREEVRDLAVWSQPGKQPLPQRDQDKGHDCGLQEKEDRARPHSHRRAAVEQVENFKFFGVPVCLQCVCVCVAPAFSVYIPRCSVKPLSCSTDCCTRWLFAGGKKPLGQRKRSHREDFTHTHTVRALRHLYRHIYLGCKEEDNGHKNFELLFTTLAVLTIELANEEVVVDLIRLALALQDMSLANEENMPMVIRCGIMALVAAYLNFLSQMIANPAFCQHVSKVIEMRNLEAPYLLPEHIFREKCPLPNCLEKEDRSLYFQTVDLAECLVAPGYNAERLSIPYVPQVTDEDRLTRRKSLVDTISLQVDFPSDSLPDKSLLAEEITFETLKKAIDTTGLEEQEKEKRRQVMEKFQKAPFEEIAAHCESKANMLHDRLAQIFELTIRPPPSPSGVVSISAGHAQHQSVPVYEMKFPDLLQLENHVSPQTPGDQAKNDTTLRCPTPWDRT